MQLDPPSTERAGSSEAASGITALKQFRLGLSRQYYAMADVLGLRRFQDFLQGASPLSISAGAVWLLGEQYALQGTTSDDEAQVLSAFLRDFGSRQWMTYRKDFAPLGASGLTSDVGWGCTLRSGQMLLGQVLQQHVLGRQWRRPQQAAREHAELAQLLSWFWDAPGADHPFSIHNLVEAGNQHGVRAGEWLGPWTLCHTLQEVVNRLHPVGLHVHLANTPGGGAAPVLYTDCALATFDAPPASDASASSSQTGLLLLVPLVLGIGKVNPVYTPQLQAVLRWPQSAGIVGGRPSSSLYFIGYQGDSIIFLDPHTVQEVGTSPKDVEGTYVCEAPRVMLTAAIDPSLAIAFYCRSKESFQDLTDRLKALEADAKGAPLLNVVEGGPPPPFVERTSSMDEGGAKGEEQWELL